MVAGADFLPFLVFSQSDEQVLLSGGALKTVRPEPMPGFFLKLKITTKSQSAFRLPELLLTVNYSPGLQRPAPLAAIPMLPAVFCQLVIDFHDFVVYAFSQTYEVERFAFFVNFIVSLKAK